MPKIITFKILDGASFWVKNTKKKCLLAYTRLDKNALNSDGHEKESKGSVFRLAWYD